MAGPRDALDPNMDANDLYREDIFTDRSVEIKTLLDDIEKDLKSIKNLYKRRQMDYDQVLEALKNLYRKLRFYQVELDPSHALDAMGNIQSRR